MSNLAMFELDLCQDCLVIDISMLVMLGVVSHG